jgi:hypothetical protein
VHHCVVDSLKGETEAGARLRKTALRDFGPAQEVVLDETTATYKTTLSLFDTPVPALLKYALTLIGLQSHGPGEKYAWAIDFTFRDEKCRLVHQKFGLRLYLYTSSSPESAEATQRSIIQKLRATTRTVERLVLEAAPELLEEGSATVVNQYSSLRRAYDYFRKNALDPVHIEDEVIVHEPRESGTYRSTTYKSGSAQMQANAFHDLVAAISAYISLLEHELVLALPFCGFDPKTDNLTSIIGDRWGEKFDRLLGQTDKARRFRESLMKVVERWRNPYSHGGFEKGHSGTIYLHAPGIGFAVPVGLSKVRDSPLFSLVPADETEISEVFKLLDQIDSWLESELPEAMRWLRAGLDVPFDSRFRSDLVEAISRQEFNEFLEYSEYQQAMVDNMDY